MAVQVRIRVDEKNIARIGYLHDWLDACEKGFAFLHDLPGNHHYHVYLFGLARNVDAMRKYLGKFLDKERYAVGVTCGGNKKLKITPEGAYQYGSTKNGNTPVWIKGFSPTELEQFAKDSAEYYKPVEVVKITKEERYIVRPDRVWERLRETADQYGDKSILQIKSKIAVDYLNNGKAIPRQADLHRYATSLYYLNKYKKEQAGDVEIPEDALVHIF